MGRNRNSTVPVWPSLIFLRFGIYKFIPSGVTGVEVWTAHSLLLFWVDLLLGPSGGRALIGVIEIVTGIFIALRPVAPRLSMFGSLMAAFAMLNTLSFLFTTPGSDACGRRIPDQGSRPVGSSYLVGGRSILRGSRPAHGSCECCHDVTSGFLDKPWCDALARWCRCLPYFRWIRAWVPSNFRTGNFCCAGLGLEVQIGFLHAPSSVLGASQPAIQNSDCLDFCRSGARVERQSNTERRLLSRCAFRSF